MGPFNGSKTPLVAENAHNYFEQRQTYDSIFSVKCFQIHPQKASNQATRTPKFYF